MFIPDQLFFSLVDLPLAFQIAIFQSTEGWKWIPSRSIQQLLLLFLQSWYPELQTNKLRLWSWLWCCCYSYRSLKTRPIIETSWNMIWNFSIEKWLTFWNGVVDAWWQLLSDQATLMLNLTWYMPTHKTEKWEQMRPLLTIWVGNITFLFIHDNTWYLTWIWKLAHS